MDFFNKLGKKAEETYQAAKEKTTNLSEELKVKGKISDEKEKIEKLYAEIGKFVYDELKEGRDASREEVNNKCEEIRKSEDEIGKLNDKLRALKGLKLCPNCQTEMDIKAEYCPKCGKEQPKVEYVEVKPEPEEAKEVENTENNNEEGNNQ